MTIVGIGEKQIEYCGSLEAREADTIAVRLPVEPPEQVGIGTEMRLMLLTNGQIEMLTACIMERDGSRLTFQPRSATDLVRRRLDARAAVCLPVIYEDADAPGSEEFAATTYDLSCSGMGLTLPAGQSLPDKIQILLCLPAQPGVALERTIRAVGYVRHRAVSRSGIEIAGIGLVEMDMAHREDYHQFIEEWLTKAAP